MKVLVIHCAYRQKGGEDTVVREELELLRRNGVETSLLQFDNEGGWRSLVQLPFNYSSYRKVRKKIAEEKPDVVHIHNLHFAASPSVIYAVRKSGLPMVMTLHNYRLLCPSATLFHEGRLFTSSLKQGFPWAAVRRGVYRQSRALTGWLALSQQLHRWLGTWKIPDRYIALTPHARELFLNSRLGITENRILVKPNFSSIRAPENIQPNNKFLYAGRLTEEKGVRLLLRTFASNRWPLRIAGAGPLEEEVRTYSKSFSGIEYLGALTAEELAKEMAAATALVFPSLWFEGMPLTIIEAFACGTPVIASDLGAMKTLVTDHFNGLHFEAGSEEALTAAVLHWQGLSESVKKEYKKNSLDTYAAQFTPGRNAAELLSIYRSVLHPHIVESMVQAALELSA